MRASIYNAMPIEGVRALVDYMKEFERRHGWAGVASAACSVHPGRPFLRCRPRPATRPTRAAAASFPRADWLLPHSRASFPLSSFRPWHLL